MEEVYNFFRKLQLNESNTVVAAISGGPDSMLLIELLLKYRKMSNFNLIVAHVNHNLRDESIKEKEDLEKYCLENNLKFEYYEIEKRKNKPLTEVEARNIRYEFFDELMKKYSATYLATAHHGDDLVETVMMKIVRGSSLRGYSGFSQISEKNGYKIIRPLISLTKKEIINYLDKEKIGYALDSTNCDEKYTRNRFRLNILPFLKTEEKNVHLKFKKFSETLNMYDEYVKKNAKLAMQNVYINNELIVDEFNKLDLVIKREIISIILEKECINIIERLNETHISSILNMVDNSKPNLRVFLPDNCVVLKEYNKVKIIKRELFEDYKFELVEKVLLPNGMSIEKIDKIDNNSNYMTRLSSSELALPLYVRNRKDSDIIRVKGMNHNKKIKDIFIDEKIPASERELWPVVEDSLGNIVWLPGLKKSSFDKKVNEEYDIILHYF